MSPTHLLYYGATPLWWCSPACETAWMQHVAPGYLYDLVDAEGMEDDDEDL